MVQVTKTAVRMLKSYTRPEGKRDYSIFYTRLNTYNCYTKGKLDQSACSHTGQVSFTAGLVYEFYDRQNTCILFHFYI